MGISSEHPVSATQVYSALVALGVEPVLDPDLRPAGPLPEDCPSLLGALLATAELETAALGGSGEGFSEETGDVIVGWLEKVGPGNRELGLVVLSDRLKRTALQLAEGADEDEDEQEDGADGGAEDGDRPSGRSAATAAVVAAANLLGAHLHARSGDPDGVRQALNETEVALADLLAGMAALRAGIGDVAD
ncbi:hypothetical protein [Streptomyces sp. NPDC018031]|uniref:hypothetical protein n=1 Tax=Streptomyces sp. NPDC018031 TaxID=3365033 RepID=UPI00379AEC39